MSQKSLKAHLSQVEQAGVYRLSAADRSALDKSADALNYASLKANLASTTDLEAVLKVMGKDLSLPDWYGANLDALNDCLTDLSWCEAKGYVLALSGVSTAGNESFATLNEVLGAVVAYWQEQDVPFWVFYDAASSRVTQTLAGLPLLK